MKSLYSIGYFILLMTLSISAEAKIWRVNNTPGIHSNFQTPQEAHDAAASGDTIHLEGTAIAYPKLTITKRIVVIGPGYFQTILPEGQANLLHAYINGIDVERTAEHTEIMGMYIGNNYLIINCNFVTVRNCLFFVEAYGNPAYYGGTIRLGYTSSNPLLPATDIKIMQCFGFSLQVDQPSQRVLLANNLISRPGPDGNNTTSQSVTAHAEAELIFQNNIFLRGIIKARKSTFTNNILVNGSIDFGTGVNSNVYNNNLAYNNLFGDQNGNKANVVMTTVFEDQQPTTSHDSWYMLRAGSPAIGAGQGSTPQNPVDAGMFGGIYKYSLGGLAKMPVIYSLEVQGIGHPNDPIDVKVKARSAGL